MVLRTHFYLIFLMFVFWGCNPQESNVEIKTNGIFRPITFGLDGQDFSGTLIDKDEWVTSDGPMEMVVTVTNHSLFPYTDIELSFSPVNNESTALRFKPFPSGEDKFPGFGGTCTDILIAGTSCTIIIELNPPIDRLYVEQAQLSFKNYVDYEQHIGQVQVLSGTPAELVIVDNPSRFRFGCDDAESIAEGGRCVRNEGLTERTIERTFTQEIKIKNVGGLKARKIQISKHEEVENVDGQDECGAYCQAWSREDVNCVNGQNIRPQEECIFKFNFTAQNRSETIDRLYERIKYYYTTSVQYEKDPKKRKAAISMNFESLSSKIEGRLTAPETLNLLGTAGTTQGNRSSKQIRLSNEGYNTTRIKELKVKYTSCGSRNLETTNKDLQPLVQYTDWAVCNREGTSNILTCRHPSTTDNRVLNLGNLPFTIQDETNCLKKNKQILPDCSENPVDGTNDKNPLIPISCGCTIRVTFQPSMTLPFIGPANNCNLLTNALFTDSSYDVSGKAIRIYPIYDSRWKNGEEYCENNTDPNCQPLPTTSYIKNTFSFKPIVRRNSAARLTVQSFKYDDQTRTPLTSTTNSFNNHYFYDLGRLTVLSASQKTRASSFRKLEITVKNEGNAFALLDKITYQIAGKTYEIKTDSTLETTLKDANNCTGNNCYYRNAKTANDCRVIAENGTCTLIINMAPFKLATDENELIAMFDSDSNGLILPKVKSFNFVYRNGYTYDDTELNFSTPPVGARSYATSLQFTAVLTKTAKLEELADTDYDFAGNTTKNPTTFKTLTLGDDFTYNLYVRNIGSKRAGKINFSVQSGYTFSGAPNCTPPVGEPKDCRCFATSNPLVYLPNTYNENICSDFVDEFLESDEVCKIPIRWKINPPIFAPELTDDLRPANNKLQTTSGVLTDEFQNDIFRVPYQTFQSSPNTYNLRTRLTYRDCYQLTITEFNSRFSPTNLPTAPANNYDTHFGYSASIAEYTNAISPIAMPAQIVPTLPSQSNPKDYPWHTAFIYRDAITSPTAFSNRVFFDSGSARSINADVTFNRSTTPNMPYFDPIYESNMFTSILNSYQYSPNLGLSALGTDDVRYRIFMGYHYKFALTSQTAFVFPFELKSLGIDAKILSITDDGSTDVTIHRINGTSRVAQLNTAGLPLSITSAPIKFEAEIKPNLCVSGSCLYKKEIEITYETGKQTRNLDFGVTYSKCSNGIASGFCEQKTIKLVVYGVINATSATPIDISTKSISVQPNVSGVIEEYCPDNTYVDYLETNGRWNQNSGGTAVSPSIQSLRLTNITAPILNTQSQREKLAYTKRVIKITNMQGPGSILRIRKLFLKTTADSPVRVTNEIGTTSQLAVDEYISNARTNCDDYGIVDANKCKEGDTLANGQSCITTIRFRPIQSYNSTIYLSYLLTNVANDSIPDDPHFIYNVPLSFQSIDPATISASGSGVSSQRPKHKASLYLDPPTVPNANGADSDLSKNTWEVILAGSTSVAPYIYSGTATPSLEREINIVNNTTTPASFLMQYRIFKDNSLTSSRVPLDSEFDANGFIQIASNFYGYTTVFAKKGCFAGSELVSDMEFGGFTRTNTNCKLRIRIRLDHNNMFFTQDRTISARVNPYLVKLKFYSAFRSQLDDIYIYAWFRVRPKELNGTGLGWGTVTSSFPTGTNLNPIKVLDDNQPTLGTIVGYRIFRTSPKSMSDDSEDNFPNVNYNASTTVGTIVNTTNILKKDFYFNSADGTSDTLCDTNGCLFPGSSGQERRFYFYRLALIRTYPTFTKGKEWFALSSANQFITNISNLPQAKILLPPTGYTYSQSNRLMILNTLSTAKLSYNSASTFCTNSSLSLFDDTLSPSVPRLLLTENAYALTGTSLTQPIWLGSSINYKFTDVGCFFLTNAINEATNTCVRYVPTATTGKKIINLQGYTNPAYAEPTNTNLGHAMCFIDLSNRGLTP